MSKGTKVIGLGLIRSVFECDECDRQFNSKKLYVLHSKVAHNVVVKFVDDGGAKLKCSVCCIGFHDKKSLVRHAKQHFPKLSQ